MPRIALTSMCLLFIAFTGCKPAPGTWVNDQIKAEQRNEFHALDTRLLGYLQTNDVNGLGNIMSKELLEAPTTRRIVELCSIRLKKSKATMLDEYHIIHATPDEQSVRSFKYDTNSYQLTYNPVTREKYIAFFKVKYNGEDWLLTANYNKYKYGWKIDEIELEHYTMDHMTAPELYGKAQQEYDQGHLINAEKYMHLARQCSVPSSIWRYDATEDMDRFYTKVIVEAERAWSRGVVLEQVPTKPKLIRVFIQDRGEGNAPMIWYLSKLNVKDTATIKKEHEQVRGSIAKLIPGINEGNKIVQYIAFNNFPARNNKKTIRYEFFDRY